MEPIEGVTETNAEAKITGFAAFETGGELKPWSFFPRLLGDGDVEVEVECCALCHSDVHAVAGDWGAYGFFPMTIGHEIVGKVTKVGSCVNSLQPGDRVGVGAQAFKCGSCGECKAGRENYCNAAVYTTNAIYDDGQVAQGGLADKIRVQADLAFRIPDSIPSAHAAPLMCAGLTAFSSMKRRQLSPDTAVGVIGLGGIGHLAVQFAKGFGCKEITCISHSPDKQASALELGATKFIDTNNKGNFYQHQETMDVLFCCAVWPDFDPNPYLGWLKKGGVFVCLSLPGGNVAWDMFTVSSKRLSIVGSSIGGSEDVNDMLQFVQEHAITPVVQEMPMSQCNQALQQAMKGDVRYKLLLRR